MHCIKIIGFLILFSCYAMKSGAQQFSAGGLLSQSAISQWTGDNGLVSNNITSAIRDHNGFVWITSYSGIMRFDGIQVSVFDESKVPFQPSSAFYTVYEDGKETLWFSSQNSGVIRYRNGKFERIDPQNKILPNSIRCLLIDGDVVWIGSNNSGLYKLKNDSITRVDHQQLNKTSILEMSMGSKRNLWIATDGEGLIKFDGKTFESISGVSNKVVNSVFAADDGQVLIGTPSGLDIWKENKLYHFDKLKDFQINKVICDKYNRVWIGAELGLARFLLNDQESFSYINESDGFPLSRINYLNFDNEDNLWISTGRSGLIQLRESNIVNISLQQGLENDKINMIYEGPDRTFYVGSDGGQVDYYKHGEVKQLTLSTPLHDAGIRDIYIDDDENIWIASYKGLVKKTKKNEKIYGLESGMVAADLRRLLPAGNGDLWLASRSGGLMKFSNGRVTEKYNKQNLLESNYILAAEKDKNDNIYLGTHSGGLSILKKDRTAKTFHIEKDDAGVLIFNIHIDNGGKVWIVSSVGLFYFDGSKFQKIGLTKSLKGEIFFDWVEDNIGNVWVTSNLGVLKMRKQNVNDFLKGKIAEVPFKLFDNRDGMRVKECTAATRSLLSSSGKIWIPTIRGISVFYPEKTVENKIIPPVFITALVADDHEVDEPYTIEPGKLRYKFFYTAPTFISPRKVQFKYKLEGVDQSWIDANTQREAEYTNLAPGDYEFRVQACNSDGYWNEQGSSIKFTVKPFFYQMTIFYVALTLIGITVVYSIYKWRVNEVEKRNAELRKVNDELDRFVYSASHDLRAPLASILGLINVARLDNGKEFLDYLKKIESSVLKLDSFIRDIIDFSRNARVDLDIAPVDFDQLINEIFENLKYLDEKNAIKRIVKVESNGVFYSDKKRISVVLNNLISNSMKYFNPHIQNSFIEVGVNVTSKQAVISVIDNGIGIAPQHLPHIFKMFYRGDVRSKGSGIGLYIVKETLDKINGEISVESNYGMGSTFTVKLTAFQSLTASSKSTIARNVDESVLEKK